MFLTDCQFEHQTSDIHEGMEKRKAQKTALERKERQARQFIGDFR